MKTWAELLARLLNGLLDAINRKRAKDAQDNVSDNLSNGGDVVQSDKSFSDLASKTKRD
ncbi:MAG: hypothetical protein WBH21_01990 [Vibrio anguillarum]